MKTTFRIFMIVVMFAAIIVACKDDFTEEDFLRQQAELKAKEDAEQAARDSSEVNFYIEEEVRSYITALNEAGDLLAVTFLMRENGNPVPGVTVTLTTGTPDATSDGRTKADQTAVTDASGNVTFERVVIGKGTVSFSKPGYLNTTANVDFGFPADPTEIHTTTPSGNTVTRYVPPTKRQESGVVNMFSAEASNENTATITGRVTIETDVTNLTPEFPANMILRANLASLSSGLIPWFMNNFAFADDDGIGVAVVAADGSYSMTVPATASGTTINFIVPNIDGTRRTAVNAYDNGTGVAVPLANGPEYRDVPVSWGPQASGATANIPLVVGAKIVIPPPPAAGKDLSFSFTPIGRSFPVTSFTSTAAATSSGFRGRITSRGNYKNSLVRPTVQISGGSGNGAVAVANMRTFLSSVVVNNPGAGYGPGGASFAIRGVRADATTQVLSSTNINTIGGSLPASIDLGAAVNVGGFGSDNAINIATDEYVSVALDIAAPGPGGTAPQVTATFVTELAGLQFTAGGDGYLPAPSITFTHPDANVIPATFEIMEFPVFWNALPDNTASSGYAVLPADVRLQMPATQYSNQVIQSFMDVFNANGTNELASQDISELLTVSNGHVVLRNPAHVLRTTSRWSVMPQMIINPVMPSKAIATFIDTDINETTGAIENDPQQQGDDAGYAAPIAATIEPAIAGAPGGGAEVLLNNSFNSNTKEWTWDGTVTWVSEGAGYLRNLNRKTQQSASLPTSVSVQPGKIYQVDFHFGTGTNQVVVE